MTNLEQFKNSIPDYAKDIKMNLNTLLSQENQRENQILTQKQIFGIALACAYSAKEKNLITIMENEAAQLISETELKAAKTASILMAMNNIYYRFTHISEDKEYSQMPTGLRMRGIIDHGIDKTDFEIFCLAVSIINGCAICIDAHANQLIKFGLSKAQIQMIAKIAAVINSGAQLLTINNNFL